MADVMNRDNLYAAPRAALHEDQLPPRHWLVEWGCAAVRAVLDLAILLLMLLALTDVFDLLQGEPRATWIAPAAFGAGLVMAVLLRRLFVAPDDDTPARGRWRSRQCVRRER